MRTDTGRSLFLVLAVIALAATALLAAAYWAGLFFSRPFSLSISSTPAGAQVQFDGKPGGATPLVIADVTPGEHRITFTLEGYREKELARAFTGSEDVIVVLEPMPIGKITVVTDPEGAKVFADGVEKGSTPVTFAAPPGKHNLVVSKEGFESQTSSVDVKAGEESPLQLKLNPALEADIKGRIAADPKNIVNYCDLMRFYYDKRRFGDLVGVIMSGYVIISDNNIRGDGYKRYDQEMKRIVETDRELYRKEILPLLVPLVADHAVKRPSEGGKALVAFLMNHECPREDWDIVVNMLNDPRCVPLRLVIAQQSTLGSIYLRRMNEIDFLKLADVLYASDKYISDKSQLFVIYSRFGDAAFITKKKYDIALKFYNRAIEVFPVNGDTKELNSVQLNLVRCMGWMGKYADALAYIDKLMKDSRTPESLKKILSREKNLIEAKKKARVE